MEFQFEITLKRMALVATALSFWRKDDIQNKLKIYFYAFDRRGIKEKFLVRLIKEVMQKVDPNSLPSVLYSEVLLVIKEMGYKMSDWFYYIQRRKAFKNVPRHELCDTFLKDVYFSHYGTIDELKILKFSWMNVPGVDLARLYIMACYYCSEDLINELWEKLPQHQFYSYEHLCQRVEFHLVAYWNKRRQNDLEGFFNDCIVPYEGDSMYDSSQSVDVNMFRHSVGQGYVRAVNYFGSKLSREEKENKDNLGYCMTAALYVYYKKNESEFYRREQYTEICLYLSSYLTDETKRVIFLDSKTYPSFFVPEDVTCIFTPHTFLRMFIYMWPWQECFKFVFNLIVRTVDNDCYAALISAAIAAIKKNFELGVTSQNSVSQRQLQQLWLSIPSDRKASITKRLSVRSLFRCDMTSAQLILNDRQLVLRDDKIKQFHRRYFSIVEKGNNDVLLEFIDKILISPEWDENVQVIIKTLYNHIMDGDLDSIYNFLGSASQEEIKNYKMMIDHELMCYYLVSENRYEQADKLLDWKFDKQTDILNFKRSFEENAYYDKDFTITHICNLWKTSKENVASAMSNSDKFLMWFLETEIAVIQFKIKHFVTRMLECYSLKFEIIDRDHFEILEDFFYWCNLHKNAFLQVKKNMIEVDLERSLGRYMKRNSIDEADKLLKWAFDSKKERDCFISEFFNLHPIVKSNRPVIFCKLYIGKYWHPDIFSPKPTREELAENFKKFINFFLMPYIDDFDELKNQLKNWPEVSRRLENSYSFYDDFLEEEEEENEVQEELENEIHCEKENCELFLCLLNSAIKNRVY